MTIGDKIYQGVSETLNYFLTKPQSIVWIMVLILAILIFKKYKDPGPRFISTFPVVYLFCAQVQPWIRLSFLFEKSNLISVVNVDSLTAYIPILLQMLWLGCVLAEVYLLFENTEELWMVCFAMAAGFAATVALGFTGSIYASGSRIFTFFYFDLIVLTLYFMQKEKILMQSKTAMLVMTGIVGMHVINFEVNYAVKMTCTFAFYMVF